jgi:hypothetical protein
MFSFSDEVQWAEFLDLVNSFFPTGLLKKLRPQIFRQRISEQLVITILNRFHYGFYQLSSTQSRVKFVDTSGEPTEYIYYHVRLFRAADASVELN